MISSQKSRDHFKGQIISKEFLMSSISSKKWTKKFDSTTMIPQVDFFLFVFWRKSKTPKNHFEIIWPLTRQLRHSRHEWVQEIHIHTRAVAGKFPLYFSSTLANGLLNSPFVYASLALNSNRPTPRLQFSLRFIRGSGMYSVHSALYGNVFLQ